MSSWSKGLREDRGLAAKCTLPPCQIFRHEVADWTPIGYGRWRQVGVLGIVVVAQQHRRANVEQRACWVVTGCGREPGGSRVAESGPCVVASDPMVTRPRLPYPVCQAMESGNEDSLREAVRQLVEGAV